MKKECILFSHWLLKRPGSQVPKSTPPKSLGSWPLQIGLLSFGHRRVSRLDRAAAPTAFAWGLRGCRVSGLGSQGLGCFGFGVLRFRVFRVWGFKV